MEDFSSYKYVFISLLIVKKERYIEEMIILVRKTMIEIPRIMLEFGKPLEIFKRHLERQW